MAIKFSFIFAYFLSVNKTKCETLAEAVPLD